MIDQQGSNGEREGASAQRRRYVFYAVGIVVAILAAGFSSVWLGGQIVFQPPDEAAILGRLQQMLLFAVAIERSVEVYLSLSDQNGPDRHDPGEAGVRPGAAAPAALAALVLGLALALVGMRLLDTVGTVQPDASWIVGAIWGGVDVLVSAGLMAGGSALVHEMAELIRGGLLRANRTMSPAGAALAASLAPTFTVTVERTAADRGRLRFEHGGVRVDAPAFWDPQKRIAAGNYRGCSKTRMATKTDSVTGEQRPAIFLPTAVAPDTGNNTIFIHEGSDPGWSDGCIVLPRDDMMRMWNAVHPPDARNVTVEVRDP